MKFKSTILYASMLAAGALVSAPAIAAHHANAGANSQVAKMEAIMNQSSPSAGDSANVADWFKTIRVSGLVNFDAAYSNHTYNSSTSGDNVRDNRNLRGTDGTANSSDFTVNNANLFVDAPINDWTNAHLNLQYKAANVNGIALPTIMNTDTGLNVSEAYVSMHNFDQTPFFAKLGVQFIDFGAPNPTNPMVYGLSQLLSQTKGTAVTVGMVTSQGFYGSVYGFRGLKKANVQDETRSTSRVNNFGGQLGYASEMNGFSFDGAIGYIYDMGSAAYIRQRMANQTSGNSASSTNEHVDGLNIHAKVGYGPFYGNVDWTKALTKFSSSDLTDNPNSNQSDLRGAKPSALDLNVGYRFKTMGHDSSVSVGYGHTSEAAGSTSTSSSTAQANSMGLYLPEHRYMAQYKVNVLRNTDLGFALVNDHDYDKNDGGSGENVTTGKVRVAVHFA